MKTETIHRILILIVIFFISAFVGFAVSYEVTSGRLSPTDDVTTEPDSEISTQDELLSLPEPESESENQSQPITETTEKAETTEPETEAKTDPPTDPPYEEEEDAEEDYNDYDSGHGGYIGLFELTAYEWTGARMANGEYPYYGVCASNYFALGTVLYIEGYGTFTVKDRGGPSMGNNIIDIYLGDEDACWEFGRKYNVAVYYG